MHGLTDIQRMTSALGFTKSFRDRACRLFSTAQEADLLRGRSIEAIAAASVYAACRCEGRPQTVEDIGQVAQVSAAKVWHGYDVLNRELELPAIPVAPKQFLPRFVSKLGVSQTVERRARTILAADETPEVRGANPAGVAAGALLLAAHHEEEVQRFTQADVADISGVSTVTVRRYRDELPS